MTQRITQVARPMPISTLTECRHCDAVISVVLEWWLSQDDAVNVDVWTRDEVENLGRRETLCAKHKASSDRLGDMARRYQGDVPPSWFDEANAGETW